MGWADGHIARLAIGETVQFRPRGHSMTGKVNDGQLCTVSPLGDHVFEVGDIVLCKANGSQYLHLVKAIQGERFQIGNNRGGINGWVTQRQDAVEDRHDEEGTVQLVFDAVDRQRRYRLRPSLQP
ncbi:MAG TPA: hypothetical protein VF403_22080, partial [Kofleriaceae bacterium]